MGEPSGTSTGIGAAPRTPLGPVAAQLAVVARLGAFPARLAAAARSVAMAEAGSGPPPGEWTPRDVVAHLVAVEGVVWQARLDTLAEGGGTEPAWTWTEPGPIEDPAAGTLEGAIRLFCAGRSLTLMRLAALDDDAWARAGVHAAFGRVDVAGLMRIAADHDDEHLAALESRMEGRGRA